MFGQLRYLLSGITVKEEKGVIRITNMPSYFSTAFGLDVYRLYKTSKLKDNIFNRLDTRVIEFNSFFAPDVLFIIEAISQHRYARSSRRVLSMVHQLLLDNTWLKETIPTVSHPSKLNLDRLKAFNLTPLPHQVEFYEQYDINTQRYLLNGFLLAAAPGTGKTFTSLSLMECLEKDVVIIISPKLAVYEVWEANITKYMINPPKYWISARDRSKGFDSTAHYHIFHYEDVGLALEFLKTLKADVKLGIIVDESHNFTDITAQRTELLVKLCIGSKSRDILYMSGTPLKSIGNDCIPIIKSIDPLFTANAEARFKSLYGKSVSRAVEVLANRMGLLTFKVPKSTVRPEKPTVIPVPVQIPNGEQYTLDHIREEVRAFIEERFEYYKLHRPEMERQYAECMDIIARKVPAGDRNLETYRRYIRIIGAGYDAKSMVELALFCNNYEKKTIIPLLPPERKAQFKDVKSVIKYVDLKIQGEALGRIIGKRRMECNLAIMPHAGLPEIVDRSIKKTVIFTSYVEVVDATKRYFEELGYKPVVVYGATNADLTNIVAKFGNDVDVNPLIATFKSLSTAVPLTMANTVVLLDQPFRHYILDQAVSRVDRLNQDTEVFIYNALLDTGSQSNISTRSQDIMVIARDMVAAIMGTDVDESVLGLESLSDDTLGYELDMPTSMRW